MKIFNNNFNISNFRRSNRNERMVKVTIEESQLANSQPANQTAHV